MGHDLLAFPSFDEVASQVRGIGSLKPIRAYAWSATTGSNMKAETLGKSAAYRTVTRKTGRSSAEILLSHLLTENIGQQHLRRVQRAGFLLVRLRMRQCVAALCLLSVAFAAAFHIFVPSRTAWDTRSVPVVYADSDHADAGHKGRCADQLIEGCHVHVCAVITSFDVQVCPDHEQASPPAAVPLVSFQPKMTGPPPKA